jgi:CRP-like cAMP-binding protein/membrane protein YdbS with pleckstrin-like domain
VTDKLEFLEQHPLFDDLDEVELYALAEICDEYEFDDQAVIAYQRDMADNLYIVKSGRLFAHTVDERGVVRDSRSYFAGDWLGDAWLFVPGAHPATIKAAGDGRLLVINSSQFLQFLEKYPNVLAKLEPEFDLTDAHEGGLTEEAWEEAQKSRIRADKRSAAINLLPDELVELQIRRSRWYLLLRILVPAVGFVATPVWSITLFASQQGGSNWGWAVTLLLMLFFGVWLLFQFLDWANDYFVITNKHLAHREFSLRTFRTTVVKIPIDQIQSVSVDRPSLIANLFNYGTARVTTAAQATAVYFDHIDDPRQVEEVLNRLRQRVKALDAARAQTIMRRSLEGHFQVEPEYDAVPEEEEDEEDWETDELPTNTFIAFWQALKRRYQGRVEVGGVVTYRKHFFVLLRVTLWPLVALLLLILANWVLVRVFEFTLRNLAIVDFILFPIALGWLTWQVEDWRNDAFQLTDRYVIDIDRKPFGFGESRKQAELSNVQNVNSDRPNFLATIFNFGNVIIDTAGAKADIVFETVANPNRVQSDIFKRRDEYRRKQALRDGDRRREEYAVLLDVYKQATEQDRIPRRTPP